jgi:GNAT superfamily N-acetyltransferase
VLLADGGSVCVRAVTPLDARRIEAFHRALSLETVHFRYFSGLVRLPPALLERFTHVDFARDMVLVAELGERVIALASYHRGRSADSAEAAFVVADEHQGRGLGTLLLEELAELARERGVTRFVADTLLGNRAMLRVFADAGFEIERDASEGMVHVRFPTGETPRARLAHELREQRAEARSIARILAPKSLLVAGALAADPERLAQFSGPLYTDLRSAPNDVDLVLYAGAAGELPPLVSTLAASGAHALLVGALAGEPGTADLAGFDHELRAAVRHCGMRLLGPESRGVLNTDPAVSLFATRGLAPPPPGRVALACDAFVGSEDVLAEALSAGVGLSSYVSLGRRADVSANDLLQFWADDPRTGAIALAVGSVGNRAKLERIAARVSVAKPIFALQTGHSELDTALARAGVTLAPTTGELLGRARERAA